MSFEVRRGAAAASSSDRPELLQGSPPQGAPRRLLNRRTRTRQRARRHVDFFFPDSQDQIDPSYDFERESSSLDRVRQRDDRYAHEVISPAPYTGILLSKALVDGPGSKYTFAQRHRLYRLGVRRFFRLMGIKVMLDDATVAPLSLQHRMDARLRCETTPLEIG